MSAKMNIDIITSLDTANVKSEISKIQKSLSQVNFPESIGKKFDKTLVDLEKELDNFDDKKDQALNNPKAFSALEKSGEKIIKLYSQLKREARDLGGVSSASIEKLLPQDFVQKMTQASQALKQYDGATSKTEKAIKDTSDALNEATKKADDYKKKIDELSKKLKNKNYLTSGQESSLKAQEKKLKHELTVTNKKEPETAADRAALATKNLTEYEDTHKFKDETSKKKSSTWRQLAKEAEVANQEVDKVKTNLQDVQNTLKNSDTKFGLETELNKAKTSLTETVTKINDLQTELVNLNNIKVNNLNQIETALSNLGIDVTQFNGDIDKMKQALYEIKAERIDEIRQEFSKITAEVNNSGQEVEQFADSLEASAKSMDVLNDKAQQIDSLKNQIKDFFGLTNTIYLFRQALQDAFETVQELDASMIEMAVVTDFRVGDFWEQLPQYTERANELGLTIRDVYDSMALFYQQGLNTAESTALSNATLKMARIAGLDAAEAVDRMTSALRGFHMELNELSANNVADVYSELAAVTASDVDELSIAMSKTASIADSAGMSFENTAAFLAQIIETTREAAEHHWQASQQNRLLFSNKKGNEYE